MLLKCLQIISIEQSLTNELYQTITLMLVQLLYSYRCFMCTYAAPMCCHGVCVQSVHSIGLLQHPTHELATRVATCTVMFCYVYHHQAKIVMCKGVN